MQSEGYASYHPSLYGRKRFGRQRSRVTAAAVIFVGLFIGVLAGRWSTPGTTVLDEFEGMCVLFSLYLPSRWLSKPRLSHPEIWFRQP